jgi:hypothetical protein
MYNSGGVGGVDHAAPAAPVGLSDAVMHGSDDGGGAGAAACALSANDGEDEETADEDDEDDEDYDGTDGDDEEGEDEDEDDAVDAGPSKLLQPCTNVSYPSQRLN